jgi:hypothetical protein
MNFFQISTSSVSQIFSYMTTLFSNLEPLIWILLGVFVAIEIVSFIVRWFVPYSTPAQGLPGEHIRKSRYQREEMGEFDEDEDL